MKFIKFTLTVLAGLTVSLTTWGKDEVTLTKNNVVVFNDVVSVDSVTTAMMNIKKLDSALPSGDAIYLVMNTPGGDIDAGIEFIERVKTLNRKVHTITLFSASMGFQIVQNLSDRLITENGTLMSHKARGGFSGEFPGQLDSRYGYYLKRVARLDEKVVARTKGVHTKQSYATLIENEYWCDGKDCIKQGFADKVVTVKCDATLQGTNSKTLKFIFFGVSVMVDLIRDACPINTGILDYNVTVNGIKLFDKNEESWKLQSINLNADQMTALGEKVKNIIEIRTQRANIKKY